MTDAGVVVVTGHRPQHLDGDFTTSSSLWRWIAAHLDRYLLHARRLRCGMALGVDLLAAERASMLGVPFDAFIPFEGQAAQWPTPSRHRYSRTLLLADQRIVVSEGEYAAWKMHARNDAMLTGVVGERAYPRADTLVAVWDGKRSGGTYQAVVKAETLGVEVQRIDPNIS